MIDENAKNLLEQWKKQRDELFKRIWADELPPEAALADELIEQVSAQTNDPVGSLRAEWSVLRRTIVRLQNMCIEANLTTDAGALADVLELVDMLLAYTPNENDIL